MRVVSFSFATWCVPMKRAFLCLERFGMRAHVDTRRCVGEREEKQGESKRERRERERGPKRIGGVRSSNERARLERSSRVPVTAVLRSVSRRLAIEQHTRATCSLIFHRRTGPSIALPSTPVTTLSSVSFPFTRIRVNEVG